MKKKILLTVSIVMSMLAMGMLVYIMFRKPVENVTREELVARENLQEQSSEEKTEENSEEKTKEGREEPVEEVTMPEPVLTEKSQEMDNGILIAIDAGHQAWEVDMSALEPNAPGSTVMKAKCTSGTSGRYTGLPEFQLNLDISLQLRTELEQRGYQVLLVREDNQTAISNAERAVMANEAKADVYIRIHANSDNNPSVHGALALVSSSGNAHVGHLYNESHALAKTILDAYCVETGFRNRGILQNDTMTGINWSQVPVMILELGFMSNEQDDVAMAKPEFQKTMVQGIAKGIDAYFEQ